MQFSADRMFPGDLHEAASRFAVTQERRLERPDAREDAWRDAVLMGWPALIVDEERGGAGGSLCDLGAVIEACARNPLGLPLVRRCAVVPTLLMSCGGAASDAVLRALCAGEIDVDYVDGGGLSCTPRDGGGVRLDGTLQQLDFTLKSTHCLVVVGDELLLLPSEALPVPSERYLSIDGTRFADLRFEGLQLSQSTILQAGSTVAAALAAADDVASLATAIEIAAMLGASVEHCIDYLSTREQFGVKLSTFQVLRHKVVELYVQYESASVLLARLVGDAANAGRVSSRDGALCKLYLNGLARESAEASIQLHGGMGMTAELPATRLARRLLCAEFEHGGRLQSLARLRSSQVTASS
jgi:alkylation response protein AidB-like acyl-CoA dehydrogenase